LFSPPPVPLPLGPAASDADEGPSEEDDRDFLGADDADDADEGFESAGEEEEGEEEVRI
jgi:hypothetical protein